MTNNDSIYVEKIKSLAKDGRTVRTTCPICSANRSNRNRGQEVMTITHAGHKILYNCHHCSSSGKISLDQREKIYSNNMSISKPNNPAPIPQFKIEEVPTLTKELPDDLVTYFFDRGISRATLEQAGVVSLNHYIRDAGGEVPCFGVPYTINKKTTGLKVRSYPEKGFAWVGGGNQGLWNIDDIDVDQPVYVVEGEIDALTMIEAGFTNVVSVPNGSPNKISNNLIDPQEDKAFNFLWRSNDKLSKVKKFIIATDGDVAGNAMAEELARRLNRSRCWRVAFPAEKNLKDANAFANERGKTGLIELVNSAEPWPIAGLYDTEKYLDSVMSLYDRGMLPSESTGFEDLDDIYRVATGQLTVVTGVPGSGKSELIDQIMINLARSKGWKFAVCSFENPPDMHIIKLAEKHSKKTFFQSSRRMNQKELSQSLEWINSHFLFIEQNDDIKGVNSTIDSILERASAAVMRIGIRGLVIDPYNYLEKAGANSETDQVAVILRKARNFAILHGVHVWFVAHPQKLTRDSDGNPNVPKGYDISGSANFYNIPDIGLTVHRPNGAEGVTDVYNWKTRFKWFGMLGNARLKFDKEIGCYDKWVGDQEAQGWKEEWEKGGG